MEDKEVTVNFQTSERLRRLFMSNLIIHNLKQKTVFAKVMRMFCDNPDETLKLLGLKSKKITN